MATPENAPLVNFGVTDNRLLQPGFTRRYFPSDSEIWTKAQSSDIVAWPGVRMVTLAPVYEPAPEEMTLGNFTCTGTNAIYSAPKGFAGATSECIFQSNPQATDCNVVAQFTPQDNQPFYADFYLQAVYSKTWYADFLFCANYCLRFLYNGSVHVMRNSSLPEQEPNWQYVQSIKTETKIRNNLIRIAVYPTAHQELLIQLTNCEPVVILDPDPLVEVVHVEATEENEAYDRIYRTIAQKQAPRLHVSSGSFYFAYRYMRFKQAGRLILPQDSLPWDYTGEVTVEGKSGENRSGYTSTIDALLVDAAGGEVGSDVSSYRVELDLTSGDPLFTPEINWAQVRIDPTCETYTPDYSFSITENGRLLSAQTGAEICGKRDAKVSVQNLDGAYNGMWHRQRICSSITSTDSVHVWWKGYFERTTLGLEQSGDKKMCFDGADTLIRLDIPLTDGYIGDGGSDNDFVEAMFKRAGLAPTDYSIDDDPIILPEALGEKEPLFQARNGKTIRCMVEYVCKVWSGKDLYSDAAGVIHYGRIPDTGTPLALLVGYETPRNPMDEYGLPLEGGVQRLKFYNMATCRDSHNFYNYIVVIGLANDDSSIIAFWYDWDSVHTPTYENYVGTEKLLILVDSNIKTQEQAEQALEFIVEDCGQPLEESDVECEWHQTLDVGALLNVDGAGGYSDDEEPVWIPDTWQVRSLCRVWSPEARMKLRLRRLAA